MTIRDIPVTRFTADTHWYNQQYGHVPHACGSRRVHNTTENTRGLRDVATTNHDLDINHEPGTTQETQRLEETTTQRRTIESTSTLD